MRPSFPARALLARPASAAALLLIAACATSAATPAVPQTSPLTSAGDRVPPPPPPSRWLPLIGEYGPDSAITIVLERGGQLWRHDAKGEQPLAEQSDTAFTSASGPARALVFHHGSNGRIARLDMD